MRRPSGRGRATTLAPAAASLEEAFDSEDSAGTNQEDNRHDHKGGQFDRERPNDRDEFHQAGDHADDQATDDGSPERPDTTDDDDHEGKHDPLRTEGGNDRVNGRRKRAGKRGHERADPKDEGEDQRHVDAEDSDHLRIASSGADDHADVRLVDEQPHAGQDDNRDPYQEDVLVDRDFEARKAHRAAEVIRRLRADRDIAPDSAHDLLEDQCRSIGQEQRVLRYTLVERPNQRRLEQHAEGAYDQGRAEDARPEPDVRLQRVRDVGAQHEERAVREIDDAHQP